jgi:hypothetical protein
MSTTPQAADRHAFDIIVRQAWVEALGHDQFSDDDYFFSIGGNSLSALKVMASIRKVTGQKFPVRMTLIHQTVNALAAALAEETAESAER